MLPSLPSTSRPELAPVRRETRPVFAAAPAPTNHSLNAQPAPTAPRRESIGSILAKNLVVARIAAGMTQHELAILADISRATIAQLEAGASDPRLSTVVDLAGAMRISPLLLLAGALDVSAFIALRDGASTATDIDLLPDDVERMSRYAASGLLKDRVRAARVGAAAARVAKRGQAGVIAAALFSPMRPGAGTRLGATLGQLLSGDDSAAPATR
jgi:DNA-binding XRE family transcriptional regulator